MYPAGTRPALDMEQGSGDPPPLLVRRTGTAPLLQPRPVRRVPVGDVDTLVRLCVDEVAPGSEREPLSGVSVAGHQLDGRAVDLGAPGDIHALAVRPEGPVGCGAPHLACLADTIPQLE